MLLRNIQLAVNQNIQILFCRAFFQSLVHQSVQNPVAVVELNVVSLLFSQDMLISKIKKKNTKPSKFVSSTPSMFCHSVLTVNELPSG